MRKGYTKRVLQAQIRKYEELISGVDNDIINWLISGFGKVNTCPVCVYRNGRGSCINQGKFSEDCPAIVNGVICVEQKWYNKVRDYSYVARQYNHSKQVRKILKTRLKYWQRIYKEKYPEVRNDRN